MTARDGICIVPGSGDRTTTWYWSVNPGVWDWIDPGGKRGTASARDHGPRPLAHRLRRLGRRRRWLGGGCGPQDDGDSIAAIHRALDARHQLDRHGGRSTASATPRRSSGARSPACDERPLRVHQVPLRRDAAGEVVTDLRAASIRRECEASACAGSGRRASTCTRSTGRSPTSAGRWRRRGRRWWSCSSEGKVRHIGVSNFDVAHMRAGEAIAPIAVAAAAVLAAGTGGRARSCCPRRPRTTSA